MNTLEQILSKIRTAHAQNQSVVCVFDLDSTLFNVSPRSEKILHEFSDSVNQVDLKSVFIDRRDWGLKEALIRHGHSIDQHPELHGKLIQYWRERFFSNEYLHYDVPYRGSVRFTQFLAEQNIPVHYLTGRDIPRMQKGSIEVLKKWGFPYSEECLHMKPYREMDDEFYKVNWFKVAADQNPKTHYYFFENEPVNINAVHGLSKSVHLIYMDTTHSRKDHVRVDHQMVSDFYIEGL